MKTIIILLPLILFICTFIKEPVYGNTIQIQDKLDYMQSNNLSFTGMSSSYDPRNCLHIMGSACGPGYTANKWWSFCFGNNISIDQANPFSVSPTNMVDLCCMHHDLECIQSRVQNSSCSLADHNMVNCLEKTGHCSSADGYYCKVARLAMLNFFKQRGSTCC